MLKLILSLILTTTMCAAFFWSGGKTHDIAAKKEAAAHAADIISLVGIFGCGLPAGAATIHRDGSIDYDPKLPMDKQVALAKTLPEPNAAVVVITCAIKQGTADQSI
jgi:hypothetical protein